jgi:hypothetical protein
MDITNDLKKILLNNKYGDEIVINIKKKQDELVIKLHLFKIISLSNKVEKAVNKNFFEGTNIKFIEMECLHDEDGLFINFSLSDKNHTLIASSHYPKQKIFFNSLFSHIKDLDVNLSNQILLKSYHILELKFGVGEKLLDLFLSEELKKIYDYNKMKIDLPNSNEKVKKIKI